MKWKLDNMVSVESVASALEAAARANLEIERKYLLTGRPAMPPGADTLEVEQGWLPGKVLRDRVRPVSLCLMVFTLSSDGSWNNWYGLGAIGSFLTTIWINHLDLVHKWKVRSMMHKVSKATVEANG